MIVMEIVMILVPIMGAVQPATRCANQIIGAAAEPAAAGVLLPAMEILTVMKEIVVILLARTATTIVNALLEKPASVQQAAAVMKVAISLLLPIDAVSTAA